VRERFLTAADREKLSTFPLDIPEDDVIRFFTLSPSDRQIVNQCRSQHNRLGFSLQLCALRYLGYCPDELSGVPQFILRLLLAQLAISASTNLLAKYGKREHTRTDHFQKIIAYLGFKKSKQSDLDALSEWLVKRALEHDRPMLLFHLSCDHLYKSKIVRPGVTQIERLVIAARQQAQRETYKMMEDILTCAGCSSLDGVLTIDEATGQTPLTWLRFGATANSPADILKAISKLEFLNEQDVSKWDLSLINPNRLKFLAQLGRRSTNQALQRAIAERRYPILVAFLYHTYEEVIDELIELFDRCLGGCYTRAKGDLKRFQLSIAKTTNEKLQILRDIGHIVLSADISNSQLRSQIFEIITEQAFQAAITECDSLIRPQDDHAYDFLGKRYSYIREFSPHFLKILQFRSNHDNDPLLKAINILRELDEGGKRKLPEDAPTDFIQKSWLTYVKNDKDEIVRRYYEISTLWALRGALRSGDIWVDDSRRYADPESYLIPKDKWPAMREEACQILGLPEQIGPRIEAQQQELEAYLRELDAKITHEDGVRIEQGHLVVSRFKTEELTESVNALQNLITQRLPRVALADLIIEVDSWTHFTDGFEHASRQQPRDAKVLAHLYASLLAQANNHGLKKMAEISGFSYSQLAWFTTWYIREETLQAAINTLVDYHFHLPLANQWGGGTLSSSDGQRFPVGVKARNTSVIPRYGYGHILTFYSWTSDQHSQWQCKPEPSMIRDATYVLDGLLDNETELPLFEHTTDTAGYTEIIFAAFDLLGFLFSPRIKGLGDQHIYCIDKTLHYDNLGDILKGTINIELLEKHWDTILRMAASLKMGWVTSSLFIHKLQSQSKQSSLAKSLQEYGRLIKSIYIPKYICREEQQRRVSRQLNKGEAIHDLRQWLFFAEEGQIKKSQLQDQTNQASALTLVTNAIIVWNTVYMHAIIEQLRAESYQINEDDLAHISPCRFEHINKHGKVTFNVEKERNRRGLRTLLKPQMP